MDDMCLVLHGQEPSDFRTKLTEGTSEEDILKIVNRLLLAVVIDKYACVDRLRLQTSGLVSKLIEAVARKSDPDEWTSQLVTTCYLLDNQHGFRISTERLTRETMGFSEDEDRPQRVPSSIMPDGIKGLSEGFSGMDAAWNVVEEAMSGICLECIRAGNGL
ncbi:hypothetical protein DOTSEDRAFT_36630 [Dothistroma septosporum NZE10]|uniref:Uncharacterized protein n=1 Tax=Dothistroma septosporum (strain NZE10 / CBS 128990) TaxID=675120 RepID=N1PEY6_DOTSN|nr:hypothetical protein DOTSEDRAFT_36630 [Dothistroma septosporum NZE10]